MEHISDRRQGKSILKYFEILSKLFLCEKVSIVFTDNGSKDKFIESFYRATGEKIELIDFSNGLFEIKLI